MKKTFIATKQTKELGTKQVVETIDTNELTIHIETYYNGKIYKKETYYHETNCINETSWNSEMSYYKENNYIIIEL